MRRFAGWLARPFRRRRDAQSEDDAEDFLDADAAEDMVEDATPWPQDRLNVAQRLFGEGFTDAGEADHLRQILPMLDLSEKKSLLLLGAGLGGVGQLIVEEAGAWVTGYENEPELAALGKERIRLKGPTRRAPVTFGDYDKLKLKPKSFDAWVSLEKLYTFADKKAALGAIVPALRSNGELWYTDFCLPSTEAPGPVVREWIESEPLTPTLWPATVTQALLGKFALGVRAAADVTREHRNRIFRNLLTFLAGTNKAELRETVGDLIPELETLGKRIAAIDSGGLKVVRFQAFKRAEKRKVGF
ncbi:MAG: class I SAM-dependent methyltransferase [Rhodospirillaceae bacterium]